MLSPFINRSQSRLSEQVRINLRINHYTPKTEESYINWIKRFILFLNKRHSSEMGETEIKSFLEDLAINKNVSSPTKNQALNGILFRYQDILKKYICWINNIKSVKRIKHLPVLFSKKEVIKIFDHLEETNKLIVSWLYGGWLNATPLYSFINNRIKSNQ